MSCCCSVVPASLRILPCWTSPRSFTSPHRIKDMAEVQVLCTGSTDLLYRQYRPFVLTVQKSCTDGTVVLYDDKTTLIYELTGSDCPREFCLLLVGCWRNKTLNHKCFHYKYTWSQKNFFLFLCLLCFLEVPMGQKCHLK